MSVPAGSATTQQSSVKPPKAFSALFLHVLYAVSCLGLSAYVFVVQTLPVPAAVVLLVVAVICFAAVVFPDSLAPAALLAVAILVRLFFQGDDSAQGLDPSILMLGTLLILVHQLAALTSGIRARSTFEWPAVRPTVLRGLATVSGFVVAVSSLILIGQ